MQHRKKNTYRLKTLKNAGLTEQDTLDIGQAVFEAEKNTSGEIATALTFASHNYSFWELLFAVTKAVVVFCLFTALSPWIENWAQRFFWADIPTFFMPALIGGLAFFILAVSFWIANIPAIDRIIVPKSYRSGAVYRRALRYFLESGVYDTQERTGILIFVSLLEREVRIIADRGICEKITQEKWDSIAKNLAVGFADKKSSKQALITAIEQCATLLAQHFPPAKKNPNELHDTLAVLEAGE
ncbi:MAG: TPM domain-containing protein [Spirochaetales bacterium]